MNLIEGRESEVEEGKNKDLRRLVFAGAGRHNVLEKTPWEVGEIDEEETTMAAATTASSDSLSSVLSDGWPFRMVDRRSDTKMQNNQQMGKARVGVQGASTPVHNLSLIHI